MKSLKRGGLVELAVEQLTAQITSGDWPIGSALPGEVKLAEQLGVGRSTVREATRELVRAGMLESRQGSGTYVLAAEPRDNWNTALEAAQVVEIYEVREAIEVQAAVLAAGRRTKHDLDAIRRALASRDELLPRQRSGGTDFVEADLAFHRTVVVAAHNTLLLTIFDSFAPVLTKALAEVAWVDDEARQGNDFDAAHEELLTAITARDAGAARLAVEHNVRSTISLYES